MAVPITYTDGIRFVVRSDSRSISWTRTLAYNLRRHRNLLTSVHTIRAMVQQEAPDVIINFYEPLCGLSAIRGFKTAPVVAIAHQFMFLHPQYQFPHGFFLQKRGALTFTKVAGLGSSYQLGISLRSLPDLQSLVVVPPLMRDAIKAKHTNKTEQFLLVYLYHHSCKDAIIEWHHRHPEVVLHCFWNNPTKPDVWKYDETLTFHPLHGEKFAVMMSRCQGMVTTSGFETLAEGIYLGKPLLLVPMRKHFEQHCNGVDGKSEGVAVTAPDFDLSKLMDFIPTYRFDTTGFREWVDQADARYVRAIEAAVEDFLSRHAA